MYLKEEDSFDMKRSDWVQFLLATNKESLSRCSVRSISSSSKCLAKSLDFTTSSFCRQVTKAHMFGWCLFIRLLKRLFHPLTLLLVRTFNSARFHRLSLTFFICYLPESQCSLVEWKRVCDDHGWRRQQEKNIILSPFL